MAESFTLPLRPPPEQNERPDTLPVEIAQINNQWGSFREVNEEILLAKIAEEEKRHGAQQDEDMDEGEQEVGEIDPTERREQLYKRRHEITQFAMLVTSTLKGALERSAANECLNSKSHQETMLALDFISLLLSKHAPRQAETSMSPLLKQLAPLGSLDSDLVNPPPRPESSIKDISTVSRGWRIQNFNSASSKLLSAATRLNGEIESEIRYWGEVLAIKDKGWKVCRHPREKQALAVQYGFMEATPIFRDRGLASLRRANDGSLILDKGLLPTGARHVRVRVKQGDQVFVSSKPSGAGSSDADSIEQRILQARDSVFEEELFHELVREARAMAGCSVTTRQNLIRIPVSDEMEILLDLVDAETHDIALGQNGLQHDSRLTDGLAHAIRILLCFAHRQNLRRRTQIPRPLTTTRPATPEYHLLRPALAYLQHLSHVRWLESFLSDIYSTLRSAGLDIPQWTSNPYANWKPSSTSPPPAALEGLVEKFLRPIESVFSGKLLTSRGSFTVTVRTNLSSLPFGTLYDVSLDLPTVPDLRSPGRLGLKDDVETAITHLLLLDLVSTISSKTLPAVRDGQNANVSKEQTWDAVYPHLGELLLPNTNPEKHKKMKVALSRHEITLTTYIVRSIDGIGRGTCERRSHNAAAHLCKFPQSSVGAPSGQEYPSVMDFVVAEATEGHS
ncbi:Mediator of RNA polymerase II transcription subunit 17 [Penicillium daleae]|uniref:Mediator of RNA polymerase II transcription subunit 17 n=1 Tax=Penicillium daleae TaxID=63821 RepID=A0AAD6FYM0_9EURO|nr:Mediator of RNA polymerase II transcription subunit 17 [Penicillium daleae]KAJ5433605.1 Mediator of RNA polymerase II transcription subunit 17 [Penicillium daleae]